MRDRGAMTLVEVMIIYSGSNGEATRGLYDRLALLGPAGEIAANLFRACKNSERAKVYRGRNNRGAAYDTKAWAMGNLCRILAEHAQAVGIEWGWAVDPEQPIHRYVLYVELPSGQVSFHSEVRFSGPDYGKPWDGVQKAAPGRIAKWIVWLFEGKL